MVDIFCSRSCDRLSDGISAYGDPDADRTGEASAEPLFPEESGDLRQTGGE